MRNVRSRSCENKNSDTGLLLPVLLRKEQGLLGMSVKPEENVECLVKDTEQQELLDEIADEVGLKHPITFDVYHLCEYYHHNKLSALNVQMLQNILSHLEVLSKSKDKRSILISKLREVFGACKCDATLRLDSYLFRL